MLAPTRKLSPQRVLVRVSWEYLMGRPVRVVRGSWEGTRVEVVDRVSESGLGWGDILWLWFWLSMRAVVIGMV